MVGRTPVEPRGTEARKGVAEAESWATHISSPGGCKTGDDSVNQHAFIEQSTGVRPCAGCHSWKEETGVDREGGKATRSFTG